MAGVNRGVNIFVRLRASVLFRNMWSLQTKSKQLYLYLSDFSHLSCRVLPCPSRLGFVLSDQDVADVLAFVHALPGPRSPADIAILKDW